MPRSIGGVAKEEIAVNARGARQALVRASVAVRQLCDLSHAPARTPPRRAARHCRTRP
jgi:hypothetical protein